MLKITFLNKKSCNYKKIKEIISNSKFETDIFLKLFKIFRIKIYYYCYYKK